MGACDFGHASPGTVQLWAVHFCWLEEAPEKERSAAPRRCAARHGTARPNSQGQRGCPGCAVSRAMEFASCGIRLSRVAPRVAGENVRAQGWARCLFWLN